MTLRPTLAATLLLFSAALSFCRDAPTGSALSSFVERELVGRGFKTEREPLSRTGADVFAHNVLAAVNGGRAGGTGRAEETRDVVFLCFTQEDFFLHHESIIPLLESARAQDYGFSVRALFSALDGPEGRAVGSGVFARNCADAERACAMLISFGGGGASVRNGSRRSVTPLWLCERTVRALRRSGVSFSFPGNMIPLHRVALLDGDTRMDALSQSGIPSVLVTFRDGGGLSAVREFLDSYDVRGTDAGDTHYLYVPFPRGFFVGEDALVRLVLAVGTASLFLLCALSFSGRYGARTMDDFLRTLPLLPLMLALCALALLLGQAAALCALALFPHSPVLAVALKFLVAALAVIALDAASVPLGIPLDTFVSGHAAVFVALANVFVFSLFDILLFVPFAAEFAAVAASRAARRPPLIPLFLLAMLAPFAPFAGTLIAAASDETLLALSSSPLSWNVLLALGLFPLTAQLQKGFFRLAARARGDGRAARALVPASAVLLLAFALATAAAHGAYRSRAGGKTGPDVRDGPCESLSAFIEQSEFQGVLTNRLVISSDADALRYAVTVRADGEVPVYDSFYDFRADSDTASFVIPDFPPRTIAIEFTSPADCRVEITVSALYRADDGSHAVRQTVRADDLSALAIMRI